MAGRTHAGAGAPAHHHYGRAFALRFVAALEPLFANEAYNAERSVRTLADGNGWIALRQLARHDAVAAICAELAPTERDRAHLLNEVLATASRLEAIELFMVHWDGSAVRRLGPGQRLRRLLERMHRDLHRDLELQALLQEEAAAEPGSAGGGGGGGGGLLPLERLLQLDRIRRIVGPPLSPPSPDDDSSAGGSESEDSSKAAGPAAATSTSASPDGERLAKLQTALEANSTLWAVERDSRSGVLCCRPRPLPEAVRLQCEYYLGPGLAKDAMLQELLVEHGGWVPLDKLLDFPRLKAMCMPQAAALAQVLRSSPQLEVNEAAAMVRPRPAPGAAGAAAADEEAQRAERRRFRAAALGHAEPPPSPCQAWLPASVDAEITVMTWNVLADFLASPGIFSYCPERCLQWPYRKALILQQVARHQPSVLLLQEVQGTGEGGPPEDHHWGQLRAELERLGYGAAYQRKTGSREGYSLGNAVLWRTAEFRPCDATPIEYRPVLQARCGGRRRNPSAQYFKGPQVALAMRLHHLRSKRDVVVATTHIICAYDSPPKQLAQVQVLMDELRPLVPPDTPLILAGDFNATPETGVYQFLSQGELVDSQDMLIDPDNAAAGVRFPFRRMQHNFNLASAYSTILGDEPPFTNLVAGERAFIGTLDYIFYSAALLKVARVLQLPDQIACQTETALPNSIIPSDHLPLLAGFNFSQAPPSQATLQLPRASR